jgi:DNA helicase-2/ATP-dependent DNA helicase PcrA
MNTDTINTTYLDHLNPEQSQAVLYGDGPLLVLAGAGTGKTRVLTTRVLHLLLQGKAAPAEILAVTFTNKAAREMTERIGRHCPPQGLWLGTFHAIGARILRRHKNEVGLPQDFTIIDTDDQIRLVKAVLESLGLDEKRYVPKLVLQIIQKWKDLGLKPENVSDSYMGDPLKEISARVYREYQQRLQRIGAVDFGDLLLLCITLFNEHPAILAQYQTQFRYVLVDEYQDTNVAQYMWMRLLAGHHRNLCCVGDDDQSIYGWRGAEVGNILKFEKDFPGAHIIRLERNYRSTPSILKAASGLISHNENRLGKTLWTDMQVDDRPVTVVSVWDEREEANYVAGEIEAMQQIHRLSLQDAAVLVRAGFQTRSFEEAFVQHAIPYRVIGGLRFYERAEIRDMLAYIRVSLHPEDDLAFERIMNVPKRGLGDTTLQTLRDAARLNQCSLVQAATGLIGDGGLRGKAQISLEVLVQQLAEWHQMFATTPHAQVVEHIANRSGYLAMWKQDRAPEAEGRVENIKELFRALEEFPTITEFMEHVSLVMDADMNPDQARVSVMTLHAAKGLEFHTVFLPGWEEGVFPHPRALDEQGGTGLEEERRLAYVGMTRARRRLHIIHAANRRVYNQWQSSVPSRFLKEIPQDGCVQHLNKRQSYKSTPPSYARIEPRKPVNTTQPQRMQTGATTFRAKPVLVPQVSKFAPGERVFHQKFGYGYVLELDGNHVGVHFETCGLKHIVDSYVIKAGQE